MTPAQKVEKAKRLLWEAKQEQREEERKEFDKHKCECGHKRKRHGKSYNINFTEGFCQDCKCKYFCMKP